MSLRDMAARQTKQAGNRAALDALIDELEGAERAEVVDLLIGEPRLPHEVVARTLNEAYGDRLPKRLVGERIRTWRINNGAA